MRGYGGRHWRLGPISKGRMDEEGGCCEAQGNDHHPSGLRDAGLARGDVVEAVDGRCLQELFQDIHRLHLKTCVDRCHAFQ